MRLLLTLLLAFTVTACTDPIIGVPGGKLKGTETPVPDRWGTVPDVVQVEMRPDDPYSINIWAVVSNNTLYIATREAKWLNYLKDDENVRVRMDTSIYELTAIEVTDEDEKLTVGQAYVSKYDYEMDAEDLSVAQVFRLTAQ